MLAPSGAALSVDRWLAGEAPLLGVPPRSLWPLRLIQVQVGLLYFFAVWEKLRGETWNDGTAVSYAFGSRTSSGSRSRPSSPTGSLLVNLLTYGTLAVELALALLVWNGSSARGSSCSAIAAATSGSTTPSGSASSATRPSSAISPFSRPRRLEAGSTACGTDGRKRLSGSFPAWSPASRPSPEGTRGEAVVFYDADCGSAAGWSTSAGVGNGRGRCPDALQGPEADGLLPGLSEEARWRPGTS